MGVLVTQKDFVSLYANRPATAKEEIKEGRRKIILCQPGQASIELSREFGMMCKCSARAAG